MDIIKIATRIATLGFESHDKFKDSVGKFLKSQFPKEATDYEIEGTVSRMVRILERDLRFLEDDKKEQGKVILEVMEKSLIRASDNVNLLKSKFPEFEDFVNALIAYMKRDAAKISREVKKDRAEKDARRGLLPGSKVIRKDEGPTGFFERSEE